MSNYDMLKRCQTTDEANNTPGETAGLSSNQGKFLPSGKLQDGGASNKGEKDPNAQQP
jgi:hypothetical protein